MATSGRIETSVSNNSKFYLQWQQASQNIANNTTTINWQAGLNIARGAAWYSNAVRINDIYINGSLVSSGGVWSNISGNGDHQLLSGTRTISHNSDGTKNMPASLSGWLYSYGNKNTSGNWDLNRIHRSATIISAQDFNDEQNPTITYSNPAGSSINSLQVKIVAVGYPTTPFADYRDISKTAGTYTFSLTTAERNVLRSQMKSNTIKVNFVLKTVISGSTYTSILPTENTVTLINSNPIFNNFAYEDINATTTALTGDNQKLINGYSNVKTIVTSANKAVAQKSATMVSYSTIIGNKQANVNYSDNVEMTISGVQSGLIRVRAVDSRNNITEATTTATLINYTPLVFSNISFERQGGVGTTCNIIGKGTYNSVDFGSVTNTITKIEYRQLGDENWTDITSKFIIANGTFENNTVTNTEAGFNIGTEYQIEVRVTDRLSTKILETTVNSGEPLIAKNKTKKLVGIGKLPDTSLPKGSLDVDAVIKTGGRKVAGYEDVDEEVQLKDYQGNNLFPKTLIPSRTVGYSSSGAVWGRFLRITMRDAYRTYDSKLSCLSEALGHGAGEIYISLYTGGDIQAFKPHCFVIGKGYMGPDVVKGVVVSSSVNEVIVDFYAKTHRHYAMWRMLHIWSSFPEYADFNIETHTTDTLPSGTQISFG